MDFEKELGKFKGIIDKEIKKEFDLIISEARKEDKLIAQALEQTQKIILAGGKRIRAALVYYGYIGAGGSQRKKILKACVAVEIIHIFLLIHDDIIDRGKLRHGEDTLHETFKKKKQKLGASEVDGLHFGEAMAIIVGDFLYAVANRMVLEAGFDDRTTILTLTKLQRIASTTVIGQSQDINIEHSKKPSPQEILAMYENKTAKYTFEGPLQVGMMMAGCFDKKTMQAVSGYSVALGIAFQIQDDILGVFGNEKKMGKSVVSDIEENKSTLMVVTAKSKASAAQKKQLNQILGKKNISAKEVKIFQDILLETGAVDFVKKMATGLLKKGKAEIEKAIILPKTKKFLLGMADYLEQREI